MAERRSNQNQIDHDLLIEIKTELGFVRKEVQEVKDNVTGKITDLETTRATVIVTDDHEKRIRRMEFWGTVAYGVLLAAQVYFQYFRK